MGIEKHQKDYRPNAWQNYTLQELGEWVHLFMKRANHRTNIIKAKKDIYDAKNYLWMMGEIIREKEEQIIKAMNDVRLSPPEEFLPKFPHMLSGGQRQRVGIARTLVLDPILLVADEPVSMIDASSRAEILYLFNDLKKKYNLSILYITHDIATAKYFSDNIAVMYLGRIVEFGDTREVIDHPLHPYTKALINAVPDPDPKNRFIQREVVSGEPPSPINPPSGCRFHTRCPYKFEPCDGEEPPLKKKHEGHHVSCYLV